MPRRPRGIKFIPSPPCVRAALWLSATQSKSRARFSQPGKPALRESPSLEPFLLVSHGMAIGVSMFTKQTCAFKLHPLHHFNIVLATRVLTCYFRNVAKFSKNGESLQEPCPLSFPMLAMLFKDHVSRINFLSKK